MNKVKKFFKTELSGWKTSEVIFLSASFIAIIVISIISGDTTMGVISSTTGVVYTLCNGKGKRMAYIFGLVNSVLYAIISYTNTLYGDAALYGLYYVPMMFVGFFLWNKNVNDDKGSEITRRKMNWHMRIVLLVVLIIGEFVAGYILSLTDDALPYIDAFTTWVQVVATVLAVLRYNEQWILWTAANAVEVVMWSIRLYQGAENAAVSLVMMILFLVIGIKMWIDWSKKLKTSK